MANVLRRNNQPIYQQSTQPRDRLCCLHCLQRLRLHCPLLYLLMNHPLLPPFHPVLQVSCQSRCQLCRHSRNQALLRVRLHQLIPVISHIHHQQLLQVNIQFHYRQLLQVMIQFHHQLYSHPSSQVLDQVFLQAQVLSKHQQPCQSFDCPLSCRRLSPQTIRGLSGHGSRRLYHRRCLLLNPQYRMHHPGHGHLRLLRHIRSCHHLYQH
mmetsp:Transcript_24865/g.29351  ORF Transcript_24865/g.29351 Transcript_24865/m.29351 type:complete len:209 (+) Transcript_24865:71-697(+)